MSGYQLDHLAHLETEAIHIMREWPVNSSGRRCSSPAARIRSACCASRKRPFGRPTADAAAQRRHRPSFPELNEFRDRRAAQLGAKLIVRKVEDAIAKGIATPRRRDQPQPAADPDPAGGD
jgi:sulfate adenylyltransferase subunit 2